MKFRWLLLGTIIAGLLVGPLIKDIPGFVVFAIGDYTAQTRLWQAIVMLIISLLLFMFCYHFIARAWNSAGRIKLWSGGRRWKKARQKTINGMIALAEGDWKKAENLLTAALPDSDTQLVIYLAAAQAAQAQKEDSKRDNYLRQAHLVEPNAEIAIGLTQAQLQLNHGQYEQALATLTHLKNLAPKHAHVLLLLQNLYRRLGDWQRFLDLVPQLMKSSALTNNELDKYQMTAWQTLLTRNAVTGGAEQLHDVWMNIPKKFKKEPLIIGCYSELLIKHGAHLEAEKLLSTQIKKIDDNRLLYLYGKVSLDDSGKQLAFAESLSKKYEGNSIWLLTLGRLCLNKELWGKARHYLEQSLELNKHPETFQELARAMEALGEKDAAIINYRDGLECSLNKGE